MQLVFPYTPSYHRHIELSDEVVRKIEGSQKVAKKIERLKNKTSKDGESNGVRKGNSDDDSDESDDDGDEEENVADSRDRECGDESIDYNSSFSSNRSPDSCNGNGNSTPRSESSTEKSCRKHNSGEADSILSGCSCCCMCSCHHWSPHNKLSPVVGGKLDASCQTLSTGDIVITTVIFEENE